MADEITTTPMLAALPPLRLVIVPTAHVSKDSVQKVRNTIVAENPDAIAVELCRNRFLSLMSGKKPTAGQLISSPLYAILYLLQQALGAIFKSEPGAEMKEAAILASQLHRPLLLADRDIEETMRMVKGIPLREKLSILLEFLLSPLKLRRAKLSELTDYNFLLPFLFEFKEKFPRAYFALVDSRNEFILRSVLGFNAERMVLVVGAGHVPGLLELAKSHNLNSQRKIDAIVV